MADFYEIVVDWTSSRKEAKLVYPVFIVSTRLKDLMIMGGDFYAVWDDETKEWSTSEDTVIEIVDRALTEKKRELEEQGFKVSVRYMRYSNGKSIDSWHKYVRDQMRDKYVPLDEKVTFSNTKVKKTDYVSKRLDYPLKEGDISAYDELIGTLYDEENRRKLEWAIGAIVSGDSKHIQKFEVLYGSAGSGKSTFLNIVEMLFKGYTSTFDARGMASINNQFALDSFKKNPLVSIQHDGDLSRIEDNTLLNSVVSHETVEVNPKYGRKYDAKFNTFLFLGTNKPVKITEAKSGLLRRLIDVKPSGNKVPYKRYQQLMGQIQFELGGIAQHCLDVYKSMGEDYYENYLPLEMMSATNDFFDFMWTCYDDFLETDHVTLTEAWKRYKDYCEFAGAYQLPMRTVRVELGNYFKTYEERGLVNGVRVRSLYSGFLKNRFESGKGGDDGQTEDSEKIQSAESSDSSSTIGTVNSDYICGWIELAPCKSLFDEQFKDWSAQYEKDYGKGGQPETAWSKCKTTLGDIYTDATHYVKPPEGTPIIMADFDLRDKDGNKDLAANLKEAVKWPPTYAELSKSGGGLHLYYFYDGDISKLSRVYAPGIEVKVFTGNSAIRRKLTLCNTIKIATISSGLPLKGEKKKLVNWDGIKNEKMLRTMIKKNLNKEYHGDTKSSVDYIKKLLDDAYESGIGYDVEDMHDSVLIFAMGSTNQADKCIDTVSKMKWKSEQTGDPTDVAEGTPLIFLDTEIYTPDKATNNPGLFLVCWKYYGTPASSIVSMENPSPEEIEALFKYDIAGYNCRDYDNHVLYARSIGKNNAQLYDISQRIINNDNTAKFGEAYNLSKWDIYEYCKAAGKRQSLKAWEIELGLSHMEMGIPWDKPAPIEMWPDIVEYCKNDVLATEAVFMKTEGYRMAREFQVNLVKALHGDDIKVTTNDTANTLTKRAIFGNNRKPQKEFNYRDLSKPVGSNQYSDYLIKFGDDYQFRVWNSEGLPEYRDYIPGEELPDGWSILPFFPGYTFDRFAQKDKKSLFHGIYGGEGGRTYSEPGMYTNVWDGDIASQYPSSIIAERLFGPVYTKIFADIVYARVAVKHGDFGIASSLLGGALTPFLSEETSKDLAQGMKIIVNAVYGLTAAAFDNEFRDPRNVDNIVAKRGNLFMLVLKEQIEKRGYKVCHIKTDSIKIPDATDEIIDFVVKFGREYGYNFETEGEFVKFALLNDAAYVAYEKRGGWITKAKQFQEPYVKKTLFTREEVVFDDLCQTFNVKVGSLYLDMNENLPDVSKEEETVEKLTKALGSGKLLKGYANEYEMQREKESLLEDIKDGHNYQFVGRVGRFCPIKPGCGGGILYRIQDDKPYAASGTTGYRWLEAEYVKKYRLEDNIDMSYFTNLVDEAAKDLGDIGDLEWFVAEPEELVEQGFINTPELYIPEDIDEEVPFEDSVVVN